MSSPSQQALFYSEERIIATSMITLQLSLAVTERSISIYNINTPRAKPQIIPLQIPSNQRIEAAAIIKKGSFQGFVAAVRLIDTNKIYFGYFTCFDGKLVNNTQLYKQAERVSNSHICFIAECEYITTAYIVNGETQVWQID